MEGDRTIVGLADKFVAIDTESGEYELDKNEMKAADRLRKRVLDPQIWLVHVSLGYLHRFGGAVDIGLKQGKRIVAFEVSPPENEARNEP